MDDSAAKGNGNRLGAIVGSEFFNNVFHMTFYRLFGNEEELGYFAVASAIRNFLQDVDLSFRERFGTHMFRELCCYLRRNAFPSRIYDAYYFHELLRRHALEHVALRTGLKCAPDLNIALKCSQHNDP